MPTSHRTAQENKLPTRQLISSKNHLLLTLYKHTPYMDWIISLPQTHKRFFSIHISSKIENFFGMGSVTRSSLDQRLALAKRCSHGTYYNLFFSFFLYKKKIFLWSYNLSLFFLQIKITATNLLNLSGFLFYFWVCCRGSNGWRKGGRSCYRRNRHSYSECQNFLFISLKWFDFFNKIT
jgi:hypothetical protein